MTVVVALLLRLVGDDAVGRQQQRRHRGGVLQRGAIDARRRQHTHRQQVAVLARQRVVAEGAALLHHLGDDDGSLLPSVVGNGSQRNHQGVGDEIDAELLIAGHVLAHLLQCRQRPQEAHAAAGDDALGNRRPRRMQRIFHHRLAGLELGLGSRTDVDLRHAAGQFRQPLLQLLPVVVAGRNLDLPPDLLDTGLDVLRRAGPLHDRRVVAGDRDLLGQSQLIQRDLVELDAEILHDRRPAGEHRQVAQHGLAPIAVAGGLDGRNLQHAAQLVDDQRRERLAGDVLGDDQQRPLGVLHLFKQRQQLLDRIDLLLVDEDQRLGHLDGHLFGVGDEVGREVSPVKLHALDDIDDGFETLALFNRDHAVLADLVEGVGHDLADLGIVVAADCRDVQNVVAALDGLGELADLLRHRLHRLAHPPRQRVGVNAGSDVLVALPEEGFGQHGRGCRAVAGIVGGLACGLLDQLRAHVLKLVAQLDLLGDRHAVLGHRGRAPGLLNDGVAAARAERALDGGGQLLDAGQQLLAGVHIKGQFLDCHSRISNFFERVCSGFV